MSTSDKKGKRKAKSAKTKQKIYENAESLFQIHGFENVSVDSIVEKAGVSKGAFYLHFDSKVSLITALIADKVNKIDLDYRSSLESFSAANSANDTILLLSGKIADIIGSTLGYERMKIIYEAQITRTINAEAIFGYSRDIYQIFSNIIKQGVEQGEFKPDINIDSVARHFVMGIRGMTYEWCIRYPNFDLKAQVLEHIKLLLAGIK